MRKQAGFSLIEMMIVVGIMGVVSLGFASMMLTQARFQRQINQSIERNDLAQFLSSVMSADSNCPCQFAGHPVTAGVTSLTGIAQLKASCVSVQARTLASVGAMVPGSQTGLKVASIGLANIGSAGANTYTADLQIQFDPDSTVVSLHPVSQPLIVQTDATGNVVRCSNAGATCQTLGGTWNGTGCEMPADPAKNCAAQGGMWNGTSCVQNAQGTCEALGGGWYVIDYSVPKYPAWIPKTPAYISPNNQPLSGVYGGYTPNRIPPLSIPYSTGNSGGTAVTGFPDPTPTGTLCLLPGLVTLPPAPPDYGGGG